MNDAPSNSSTTKTPTSNTKRSWHILIWFIIAVVLFILVAWWIHRPPIIPPRVDVPNASDLLSSFTILPVPRSKLELGARFIEGQGPIGNPPKIEYTSTGSFNEVDIHQSDVFVSDAREELANYLAAGTSQNQRDSLKVSILKVSVVRVADLQKLPLIADNEYLWEGLQVESYKVNVLKGDSEAFRTKLQEKDQGVKVTISADAEDMSKDSFHVDGSNLFIGYRVVRLELSEPHVYAEKNESYPVQETNLGNYRLQFSNGSRKNPPATSFDPDCTVKITITSFQDVSAKSLKQQEVLTPCNGTDLSAHISGTAGAGSDIFVDDTLKAENFAGKPELDKTAKAQGHFVVERRSMKPVTVPKPNAPGWNRESPPHQ